MEKAATLNGVLGNYKEKWMDELGGNEPLAFGNLKTIGYYINWLRDLDVGHIFDLTVVNGGLAIAAAATGTGYDGVCANERHATFSNNVIDRSMVALLATEKSGTAEIELYCSIYDIL